MHSAYAAVLDHFFDDFFLVDRAAEAEVCMFCIRESFRLLGFKLDPDKSQPPAQVAHILGVVFCTEALASERSFRVHAKPTRLANFEALVESILARGALPPSLASSLLGKFGFLCSTLFGKLGRCCTGPLRERQYSASSNSALTEPMRQALHLMCRLIRAAPPRGFRFDDHTRPLLLYTDASDVPERVPRYIVGGVLVLPEQSPQYRHYSWEVPQAIVDRWLPKATYMNQLETLAAPLALATWSSELAGRDVLHFVDNDGAASSLVKGFSPKQDTSALAGEYWVLAATRRINLYIDRVESKSNLADGPSRQEFAFVTR